MLPDLDQPARMKVNFKCSSILLLLKRQRLKECELCETSFTQSRSTTPAVQLCWIKKEC